TIAMSRQSMSCGFELRPQLAKIVDLTVTHGDDRPVFVSEGLMAPCHVDDRQTSHSKQHGWLDETAVVVWAAMHHGCAHSTQYTRILAQRTVQAQDPVDSAHEAIAYLR